MNVNTTYYEFVHGRKPRGRGAWAFELRRRGVVETILWVPGLTLYSDAKRQAVKKARELNCSEVRPAT